MSSYGGGGGGSALSDAVPKASGIVNDAGVANEASRGDHVHVGMNKPVLRKSGGELIVYQLPGWETQVTFGSSVVAANEMYYTPIYVATESTFDRIRCNVVTENAGAEARMGIYGVEANNDQGLHPDALVLDAGVVDCGSTGSKAITIDETLAPGWYFLVIICDTAIVKFEAFASSTRGALVTGLPESAAVPEANPKALSFFRSGLTGVVADGMSDPAANPGGYYAVHKVGYVRLRATAT